MAKWQNDSMLDAALNYVKTGATHLLVIKNYTFGDSYATVAAVANVLADKTITTTDFTGPADGTTNGRKLTVNAQSGMTVIGTDGTATHVALTNGSNTVYYATALSASQALVVNGTNTCNTQAWDITIADPT